MDDTLHRITWTADANPFKTLCDRSDPLATEFVPQDAEDATEICTANGQMTWNDAKRWMEHLNAANYKGYDDWRLPSTETDSDCYRDSSCPESEMSGLYYLILGNQRGGEDSECFIWRSLGDYSGAGFDENYCLVIPGPFSNIQPYVYWSGTVHPDWGDMFFFQFKFGKLDSDNPENLFHVWPVRSH